MSRRRASGRTLRFLPHLRARRPRLVYKRAAANANGGDDAMAQLRIPLDAQRFSKGLTWKDYMAQMGDTRARTEDNYAKSVLTAEEQKAFSGLSGVKYAMMLAENWCGDVHRNSPLIAHVCESLPGCELRVFFRDKEPDLRDAFLNNGYQSIPVVVFFDQNWNEIGRWLERSHAATAKAAQIRGNTLDKASKEQQDAATAEFRKQVQDAYMDKGHTLWRAAANEMKLVIEQRVGKA